MEMKIEYTVTPEGNISFEFNYIPKYYLKYLLTAFNCEPKKYICVKIDR